MRQTLKLITLVGLSLWTGAELVGSGPHDPHQRGQNRGTYDRTRASHPEVRTLPATHPETIQAPLAVCFAPGTPPDVMARVNAAIFPPEPDGSRYFVGSSWTAIGQPTTLTWSFVPDGLYISGGVGEPGSPSTLFSTMDSLFGSRQMWMSLIRISFERWGELAGIEYVRVTDSSFDWDDGASWGSGGGSSRGDIRISMHDIDGGSGILAYNYFPQFSDMVLDAGESWADPYEVFRFLRNIIMHEHGHGLGLYHACSNRFENLMDPYLNLSIDGPQHDDIRGAQRQHGDPFEPDDTFADASDLGTVEAGTSMVVGEVPSPGVSFGSILSIDENGEEDWFRFSLDGSALVNLTLTPIGKIYDNSPQLGNGSCSSGNMIDSERIANLNFQLFEGDGSTIIATASAEPAGQPESVFGIFVPNPADFSVRVYESDNPTGSQLYTLEIRVDPTNPPRTAPWPHDARKNRYVSFDPNNYETVAFQIELTQSGEFPGSTGVTGWVGEPDGNDVSRIVDSPYYTDAWPDVVHVGDCAIIPVATYQVRATPDGIRFTVPSEVATIHKPGSRYYGDVVGQGNGFLPPDPGFTPPNGVVNVTDTQAYVLTAQGPSSPSAHTTWVDLHGLGDGSPPNFILNISDLQRIKFGFQGTRYADTPDQLDPADCP